MSSSSPTSSSMAAAASVAAEEMADEVKVFRTNDAEDANDLASSSAELIADKKDLALEAEIESQTEPLAQRMITPLQSAFMNVPSPSYDFLFPLFMTYAAAAVAAAANNPLLRMSPVAAAFSSAHFAAALARHSPSYMQQFGAPPGGFHNPATGGFLPSAFHHHLHNLQQQQQQQQQHPGLSSPLTSMANGLGGISLGNQQKQHPQQQQQQRKMHQPSASKAGHHHTSTPAATTPKTPKREKERATKSAPTSEKKDKHGHIKKPCNAFMWFMKCNRHTLLAKEDCQQKQSALLNQQLGKIWQSMAKKDQQPYYDLAAKEREEHQQQYPNWTARDNYAVHKKKRRKRERSLENNEMKKCRARFGVDNQTQWCKHCKRKKRCLNARDTPSPLAAVTSTTNSVTPSSSSAASASAFMQLHQQPHSSSSMLKQYMDSPSSSGMSASVDKRSESNASSVDTSHQHPHHSSQHSHQQTPPPTNGSAGEAMELTKPVPLPPNNGSAFGGAGVGGGYLAGGGGNMMPACLTTSPHSFFKR